MSENEMIITGNTEKKEAEKAPTEMEWFALFQGIAASLKIQADLVRED